MSWLFIKGLWRMQGKGQQKCWCNQKVVKDFHRKSFSFFITSALISETYTFKWLLRSKYVVEQRIGPGSCVCVCVCGVFNKWKCWPSTRQTSPLFLQHREQRLQPFLQDVRWTSLGKTTKTSKDHSHPLAPSPDKNNGSPLHSLLLSQESQSLVPTMLSSQRILSLC